ncbi:MAG: glycosyltransferase family 4 protein [Pseudomonadota bacterium]
MRILITARWPVGGIRTFLKYVYQRLDASELQLAFALPDMPEARQLADDLSGRGYEFHWSGADTRDYARTLRRLCRETRYDLVHSHGFTALLVTRLIRSKARHLVTVHDVLLEAQLSGLKGWAKYHLLRHSLRRVEVVHAVSEACAENLNQMLSLGPSVASKITVVRNGIDVSGFVRCDAEDVRSKLRIDADALVVGFFGRFMNQKGFRYLADAVSRINEAGGRRVVVVCVGSGGFLARDRRDIEARGLSAYFIFADFVPHVGGLMKGVDCVVMPSLWEACGLVAMEAMVAGSPLLATDIPALRELTAGSPAHLVPVRDSKAIASVLSGFDVNRERASSAAFAERAAQQFDVGLTIAGIRDLYARLA